MSPAEESADLPPRDIPPPPAQGSELASLVHPDCRTEQTDAQHPGQSGYRPEPSAHAGGPAAARLEVAGGGVEVEGAAEEVVVLLGASVVAGAAVVVVGAAVVLVDGGAVVVTAAVVAVPPLPSLVEVPPVVEVLAVVEVLFAAPSSLHPHPSKANGTPMTRAMTTTAPIMMYLSICPLLG